jgi:predicted nuclease of predicted toxin-antitoxin system
MRIKLDENLPAALASRLSAMGHGVLTVPDEELTGKPDPIVWEAAQSEARFLITQDLHLADMRRFAPGSHHGILLVRLRAPSRRALVERVGDVFAHEEVNEWMRCLVVVTERKVRVRRPPEGRN